MDENLAYQSEYRQELIGGKIVLMAPTATTSHNRISYKIGLIFGKYLEGKTCVPFGDGEKVFLSKTDHFIPDFMVVCDRDKIKPDGVYGAPDLVVEILSPSTGSFDRGRKKRVYESCGVPEYWIVSPEAQSVDVYLLQDGRYELEGSYAVFPDWMLKSMTEEEIAQVRTSFRCHLFDDLEIKLDDIFSDLF